MKILLLRDVERLGEEGSVVEVKDGYARNYLIPQGFALPATPQNIACLDKIKEIRTKVEERQLLKFVQLKERIEKLSLTITLPVKKDDELYGGLSESKVAKALREEGIEISSPKIIFPHSIRKLGVYNLTVDLHPKIKATLKVWVVKK